MSLKNILERMNISEIFIGFNDDEDKMFEIADKISEHFEEVYDCRLKTYENEIIGFSIDTVSSVKKSEFKDKIKNFIKEIK